MKVVTIEVYEDKQGKHRWRCLSGNNRQLSRSPMSYVCETKLMDDICYIAAKQHDAELYQDVKGEWRWRFKRDGRIIAIASEGYVNKKDCKHASDLMLDAKPV